MISPRFFVSRGIIIGQPSNGALPLWRDSKPSLQSLRPDKTQLLWKSPAGLPLADGYLFMGRADVGSVLISLPQPTLALFFRGHFCGGQDGAAVDDDVLLAGDPNSILDLLAWPIFGRLDQSWGA